MINCIKKPAAASADGRSLGLSGCCHSLCLAEGKAAEQTQVAASQGGHTLTHTNPQQQGHFLETVGFNRWWALKADITFQLRQFVGKFHPGSFSQEIFLFVK